MLNKASSKHKLEEMGVFPFNAEDKNLSCRVSSGIAAA